MLMPSRVVAFWCLFSRGLVQNCLLVAADGLSFRVQPGCQPDGLVLVRFG